MEFKKATGRWDGPVPYNLRQHPYLAKFTRYPTSAEVDALMEKFADYAKHIVITFFPPGVRGGAATTVSDTRGFCLP